MAQQVADGILPQAVLDEMVASSGGANALPDWYRYLVAADRLKVPVWDVAGLPETAGHPAWVAWALAAAKGEGMAQAEMQRRAERKRS